MALLRIQVASKEFIEFTPINLNFIREDDVSVNTSIPYTNGSGQEILNGDVLYETGAEGVVGFIRVKANGATTLGASGNLPITIEHYPSETQAVNALSFTYDGSTIIINLTYNSLPVAQDVIIPLANRGVKTFSAADFDYSDDDSDPITEIALFGAVDGYEFNGALYISGTWIPVGDLNLLTYVALDQDGAYNKDVTWKVKDINGNISV